MIDGEAEQNPEHPTQDEARRAKSRDALRRRVGEATVLALYFIFEFKDAYNESHERAILQVLTGVSAVLLIEFRVIVWIPLNILMILSSYLLYLYVGPTPPPPPPKPTIGWLLPSDRATPTNACSSAPLNEDSVILIAGSDAFVIPRPNYTMDAIVLGWCRTLTIHSTENGITMDTNLFDPTGKKFGSMKSNDFIIDGDITVEKDLNTPSVHDLKGNKLLYVSYLNKKTIIVRGNFFCPAPNHVAAILTDNSTTILPGRGRMTRNCTIGSRTGIVVR